MVGDFLLPLPHFAPLSKTLGIEYISQISSEKPCVGLSLEGWRRALETALDSFQVYDSIGFLLAFLGQLSLLPECLGGLKFFAVEDFLDLLEAGQIVRTLEMTLMVDSRPAFGLREEEVLRHKHRSQDTNVLNN
jgi:hypothetical protein